MTRAGYLLTATGAALLLITLAMVHVAPRLVWNASASVPVGLYEIGSATPLEVTDLVAVNAPEPLKQPEQGIALHLPVIAGADPLSPREIEVAKLVAEGFASKEIADKLVLSVRTVEKHRANIMDKTGVRDVASLTRYCIHYGLVHA